MRQFSRVLGLDQHDAQIGGKPRAKAGTGNSAADYENVELVHGLVVTVWKAESSRAYGMTNIGLAEILLVVLAIILVVAAFIDVRTFTISNGLNATVALLAPFYWWSVGLPFWPDAAIQIGVAVAVFGALAITFYIGMMGGGDVKLASALALWFSPVSTVRFLVIMSLAGGLLTLVVLILHRIKRRRALAENGQKEVEKPEVPYGVAIAIGALWILAQRFLNQFA
jgi:prepilin peptidase CpaA